MSRRAKGGGDKLARSLGDAIADLGGHGRRGRSSAPAERATYSLSQAAAILEVHRNTLAKWLEQGAPAIRRPDRALGGEWELSVGQIVEWRLRRAVEDALAAYQGDGPAGLISEAEARRRKAVAEAISAEIEAEEQLKRVVGVEDVEDSVTRLFGRIRTLMASLPAKIAGRAATMTSAPAIQSLVEHELRLAFMPLDDPQALARIGLEPGAPEEAEPHGGDDDLGATQPA